MQNPKVFVSRAVTYTPFGMAPVEIVVPFHGEQAKVTRLVEGVFSTVHTNRYLLTLVDDGSPSPDFVADINKAKIPGVRCLRTAERRGFGAAVNLALRTPFGGKKITYVAIMHSDVSVTGTSWLSALGDCLLRMKRESVRMVSPLTDCPQSLTLATAARPDSSRSDSVLAGGDYLPLYCALAHRELFERVGPLKEFPYAGTEAQEYADRMRRHGYLQGVCGSSWVHHEGRGTLKNYDSQQDVVDLLRKVREEYNRPGGFEAGVLPIEESSTITEESDEVQKV